MRKPILRLTLALFTFLVLFPLSSSQAAISQWPGLKELLIDKKMKEKERLKIQDVIDHRGDNRKVLICGRNMYRIRTDGKSIVQLARVAH